jgi:hypothetical protein
MLLLKTAIMLEWIRIFVPHHTRNIFYWSSVILILMNAVFYAAGIAVALAACRPMEKRWHFWVAGTCMESRSRDIASAAINLVLDTFILALPQRIIWNLQTNARRRTSFAVAFSVGLLYVCLPFTLAIWLQDDTKNLLFTAESLWLQLAVYIRL